jgi:hypothetical protein
MYPARIAIAPDHDNRRTSRRLVNFAGSLREGAVSAEGVTVTDLDERGCRVTTALILQPETAVWIKIAGMNTLRARVAWVNDGEIGCEFCTPLEAGDLLTQQDRGPIERRLEFGTRTRPR